MPAVFPAAFDVPSNPNLNTSMAGSGFEHDLQHVNINDMMKAVQVRIGITGSPDTTSVTNQVNTAMANITVLQGSVSTLSSQLGITNANLTSLTTTVSGNSTSIANLTATKLNLAGGSMTGQLIVQYRPPAVSLSSYTTSQLLLSNTGSADNPPQLGFQATGLLGLSLYLNASGLNAITNQGGSSLIINTSGQLNPLSFADGSIPGTKIAPGSIGTAQIASASITGALLAPGVAIPSGAILDYAGGTAPTGWLLCNGASYPTATYPTLYAAIGYTWGGSGANFNVPDFRGRTSIGAGQGAGLTNRVVGAPGGEELHALSIAELAAHNHTASQADHYHTIPGGGNHNHTASQADHQHAIPASGNHTHNDAGHTHPAGYSPIATTAAAGSAVFAANGVTALTTGTGYASLSYSGNIGPTVTYWASQTANGSSGIPAVTVNNCGNITPNTAWVSQTMAIPAVTVNNAGSGTAHNNMMPFAVATKIIKI
jgi:microcystin-dependent protein